MNEFLNLLADFIGLRFVEEERLQLAFCTFSGHGIPWLNKNHPYCKFRRIWELMACICSLQQGMNPSTTLVWWAFGLLHAGLGGIECAVFILNFILYTMVWGSLSAHPFICGFRLIASVETTSSFVKSWLSSLQPDLQESHLSLKPLPNLIGGLEHILFFHMLEIVLPIDFHIF